MRTLFAALLAASVTSAADEPIRFNRDVRPILSDTCFACHGPDTRKVKADLRFDVEKLAKAPAASGETAIVPGDLTKSELYKRITATDDTHMPSAGSGKKLTPEQIATLKKWIEQGAKWEDHWSFVPIAKAAPPAGAAHPVDAFIRAKLTEKGLKLSPEADRVTLLRRLSFDLIGLPPTPNEVEAFVADQSPNAFEKQVDRLLASEHYGERMAMFWLDVVRYADSVGYHGDQEVSVWPFRDYVIKSFNDNKRFDVFTREQLAGDLMPNATTEQKVASGYNRLGMMSAEGGVQPKEYLAKYASERVRAVSGGWLGLTTGCAECHDHKFDPISTKDFYRMEAFFADIQERGLYGGNDFGSKIRVSTKEQEQQLADAEARVAAANALLAAAIKTLADRQVAWESTAAKDAKLPAPVKAALAVAAEKRNDAQKKSIADHFAKTAPELADERQALAKAEKLRNDLSGKMPTTLVTVAVPPREIRVLKRGNWMDTTGEVVTPGTLTGLPELPRKDGRYTRADLAGWLVSQDNPLTARVLANRLWKLYFGAGLARKLDDLGSQGEPPTHPELLDSLAHQLRDTWDVKALVKLLVMSDTYRQSSVSSAESREKDPFNFWLARQSRWRLDAEMVRDNALATSGLLSPELGGPSVKPYQPGGYWSFLNFPKREWQNDTGDDLYRRGLYTHWQRQYLHPALLAFDAPSREECTTDRVRSNTPLQSLVLLNDPEFVEAARVFAEAVMKAGTTTDDRLDFAFRRALSRPAKPVEKETLAELLKKHTTDFRADPKAAKQLIATGAKPIDPKLDPAELAAWTNVTRTILNLHASVTRN